MIWRAVGLVALLACAASAQAAPVAFRIEYGTPAQLEGTAGFDGLQWALFVFHDAGAQVQASFPDGAVHVNHTWAQLHAHQPGLVNFEPLQPLPRGDPETMPPGQTVEARFGQRPWSSLYVVAQRIAVTVGTVDADIHRTVAAEPLSFHVPASGVPTGTYREGSFRIPADGAAFGLQGQAGFPFTVSAEGLNVLEWHNATTACNQEGHCPDGAESWTTQAPGLDARLDAHPYANVSASTGSLEGAGQAWLAVVGGSGPSVNATGLLHLPRAVIAGTCGETPCPNPDGRTFTAQGTLALSDMRPGIEDRLAADAHGELTAAIFDEQAVLPSLFAPAVAVAAVGLTTAFVLWFLFARRPNADPLEHPRAQALRDLIHAEPGLSFRELLRRTGWSNNSVRRHLDKLLARHHIVRESYRNTERYFENHGRYKRERDWKRQVLLGDEDLKRLLDLVAGSPGITQTALLKAAKAWNWSRTATQRRLETLADERFLVVERKGRTNHYRASPGPGGPT